MKKVTNAQHAQIDNMADALQKLVQYHGPGRIVLNRPRASGSTLLLLALGERLHLPTLLVVHPNSSQYIRDWANNSGIFTPEIDHAFTSHTASRFRIIFPGDLARFARADSARDTVVLIDNTFHPLSPDALNRDYMRSIDQLSSYFKMTLHINNNDL